MSDFDGTADDRPTPPDELEDAVATLLEDLAGRDPEQLAAVAAYAEDLDAWAASAAERSADSSDGAGADAAESGADDYPDGVPERATVTVTEIAGTEYRYYQWREGDEIRSKTVEL